MKHIESIHNSNNGKNHTSSPKPIPTTPMILISPNSNNKYSKKEKSLHNNGSRKRTTKETKATMTKLSIMSTVQVEFNSNPKRKTEKKQLLNCDL